MFAERTRRKEEKKKGRNKIEGKGRKKEKREKTPAVKQLVHVTRHFTDQVLQKLFLDLNKFQWVIRRIFYL